MSAGGGTTTTGRPTSDPVTAGRGMREPVFPEHLATSGTLVRECARRWGDKAFVVLGDRRLSYAQADQLSAGLARGLLAAGIGKGTHVGLLAPNGPEWVLGWLAATRIGAVVALLNTYSKAPELGRALRHADVAHLLTVPAHLGHDYLERLESVAPGLTGSSPPLMLPSHPYLRHVWSWGDEPPRSWCGSVSELVASGRAVPGGVFDGAEAEVHPSDPMVLVFSSGSTGEPKAVLHSHGATVRHAHNLNRMRDLRSDDVLYTPMPLFWVGGFSFTLVAAMHAGCTLVFEERFEPGATLELIETERVTRVLGWPHMAKALVDHPDFAKRDLSSVRGGNVTALLPPDEQATAEVPKATSLGMTETLGPHTFSDGAPLDADHEGSFGMPVPGLEHRVVDPVTLEDLPPGEVGELWLRGYPLMLGLHKRERAETFTADGWYRTGDAGRFDTEGHFYFTGRMGDLIKSAGMNITPREVEAVLEDQPEVAVAFVTGLANPERGQEVVAAIALREGETLTAQQALSRLATELSSYKVPRHIAVFAAQSELPMLESGKLDRRRLAGILQERFGTS